jgi:hypothetical protein
MAEAARPRIGGSERDVAAGSREGECRRVDEGPARSSTLTRPAHAGIPARVDQPRNQHYCFAHKLLAHEAHHQPERIWGSLTGEAWSDYLSRLWMVAGEGEPAKLSIRGLGVEGILTGEAVFRAEGLELVTVRMPPPVGMTEVFYAVLARRAGTTGPLRYFVFEQRVDTPGAAKMAEWRADESRLAYGDAGMNPTPESARDQVLTLLRSEGSFEPPARMPPPPAAPMVQSRTGVDISRPFLVKLSMTNKVKIWMGMPLCGIGVIWWLLFQKDPEVIDPHGITLRSGRRKTWSEMTDLRRIRVVGAYSGARRDYYIQMWFGGEIVNLNPAELENGEEALLYMEALFGARMRDE